MIFFIWNSFWNIFVVGFFEILGKLRLLQEVKYTMKINIYNSDYEGRSEYAHLNISQKKIVWFAITCVEDKYRLMV